MPDLPSATTRSAAGAHVHVTVTTIRAWQDEPRQSTSSGDFDTAIREALSARLKPWAIDQVLGRVLARRPAAGDAVQYEGSSSPGLSLRITVTPTDLPAGESPPPCRTRRLAGLFLPAPAAPEPVPAADGRL